MPKSVPVRFSAVSPRVSRVSSSATGLEDLQLAYELESLQSLNVSGCSAITPDALLVRILSLLVHYCKLL